MKNGKPNLIRDIIELLVTIAVWGILLAGFFFMIRACAGETARQARRDSAEASAEREGAIVTAKRYGAGREAEEVTQPLLEVYTEGCGEEPPEWWRPDEEMAVVWEDHSGDINKMVEGNDAVPHYPAGIDSGGVDWNICSSIVGWDGRMMEIWELDLWARVFYLEFYGASEECCAAGCDAMLNLWATGKYGRTLFDCLSYYDPDYGYTYEVYPWVWDTTYDPDGLEWCRSFCEERFFSGPEWGAAYFQLGGYHDPDWVTPAYEIDGVYFSTGKE